MATDTRGLDRFISQLNKIRNKNNILLKKIVEAVAEEGERYLSNLYSLITNTNGNKPPRVTYSFISDNKAQIIAYGEDVAFVEFGTGQVGDGTYKGETPKENVPITGAWKYAYISPSKKINQQGEIYWTYYDDFFSRFRSSKGNVAGNQIYETAKYLREQIPSIVKKVIREEL